jgi:colanic acid biosynthesis glycosyl transferase WcaI
VRLLVFADLYKPDHAGGAAIYTDFCETLAARGHQVTVRCAYPYFPEWVDKSGRNGWRIWRREDGGVAVEHHGQRIPARRSTVDRLLYEGSNLASLLRSTFSGRHDAVLVFSTRWSSLAAAAVTARVRRIPLLANVQDISTVAAEATGYSKGRLARAIRALESLALRSAAVVTTLAPGMVDALQRVDRRLRPVVVPNWANRSLLAAVDDVSPRPGPGLDPPQLLYAGNVGLKQGLAELCQRLHTLEHPFHLRIHASGPGAAAVRDWVEATGDRRFEVGPFLPEVDFVEQVARADLFLICELESSGDAYMPSKLIPAVLIGTPVLAVCDPAGSLGREVAAHDLGPLLRWTDLGDGVLSVTAEDWERWHEACRARACAYRPEPQVDRLVSLLEGAIEEGR